MVNSNDLTINYSRYC